MSLEPVVPIEFKDRKTGLLIFGILTALMGAVCALFPPVMLLGQAVSARTTGVSRDFQTLIPGIVVFTSMAITFIWLGIGSMKARRWARALLLVVSWSWLVVGIILIAALAAMVPQLSAMVDSARQPGQPEIPASAKTVIMAISGTFVFVTYVVIPAVWVFFYGSRHVKATCEARDPVVRWTDRCPLPVLACVLWLGFSALVMLIAPLGYRGVLPLFGTFVSGLTGSAIYLVLAGVWIYAAWALYHLDRRGWWIIFVGLFLFGVSAFMTYSRHDVTELYRLMGTPEQQIAEIQKFNFLKGKAMAWTTLICTLPFLGYLLYVRKFLRKGDREAVAV